MRLSNAREQQGKVLSNYAIESPVMGIIPSTSLSGGVIKDETLWLRAWQARNNVTHSYNQNIALGIVKEAKNEFYQMFLTLKDEIDSNWLLNLNIR